MFVKLMEEQEQRKRFEEEQKQRNMVRHLFTIDYQHLHSAMLDYVYSTYFRNFDISCAFVQDSISGTFQKVIIIHM